MPTQSKSNGNGRGPQDPGLGPFLSMGEVCERAKLSPSFVYEQISRNLFPRFMKFGPRCRKLPEYELDLWLAVRLALREQMPSLRHSVALPEWPPKGDVEVPCRGIRMMRWREVLDVVPVGRTQLYRLMNVADPRFRFPWPAPLGEEARRWAVHEVYEWLRRRRGDRARDLAASRGWVCQRPGSGPDSRRPRPSRSTTIPYLRGGLAGGERLRMNVTAR